MPGRQSLLEQFQQRHRLPQSFGALATQHYFPLLSWLTKQKLQLKDDPLILGINGSQGSGKSTLADFIEAFLSSEQGWNVAVLSIDDFYLTRSEREQLAKDIHPLLITRGVPGTHDVTLAEQIIGQLCQLAEGQTCSLPRFDKSIDDRSAEKNWPSASGNMDLIILEGWCVGSLPADDRSLLKPINALEADEDQDGSWRKFVNESLKAYQPLFARIHKLVMLKAPSFEAVYEWRCLQEQKLAESRPGGSGIMNEAQIARFIQHYQRITEENLQHLPERADVMFELDSDHNITGAYYI